MPVRKTAGNEVGDAKVTYISRGKHDISETLENWRAFPFLINHYDQSAILVVFSLSEEG